MDAGCYDCEDRVGSSALDQPRFASAGITADGYESFRVRRWEKYQRKAIAKSYAAAVNVSDAANRKTRLAEMLTTCLVVGQGKGASRLAKPGPTGVMAIVRDVSESEIDSALQTAMQLSAMEVPANEPTSQPE